MIPLTKIAFCSSSGNHHNFSKNRYCDRMQLTKILGGIAKWHKIQLLQLQWKTEM